MNSQGAQLKPTRESENGGKWTAANGEELPKLGSMMIKIEAKKERGSGRIERVPMQARIEAGAVDKTLRSVSRLEEVDSRHASRNAHT